jgi:GPH family glycoside/pentoside/hexuronide:cation symporter
MIRLAYTIITLGSATLWGLVGGWLLYFYVNSHAQPLVSLALYGLVMLGSKTINIIIALWVGYASDRTHAHWGRRLPYIIGGGVFLPVLFYFLWRPPYENNPAGNLLYLLIALIAFGAVYQIHQVPYEALLPELAVTEKERVGISTWRTGFLLGGNLLAGAAGPLISRWGYADSMGVFAAVAAPIIILPGFFLRRHVNQEAKPVQKIPFTAGLKTTFANTSFQVFILSWGLMWIASTFIISLIPFIVTEICGLDTSYTIYFYLSAIIATFAALPLVNRLSKRYGIKTVYQGSLLAGGISLPLLMLIGEWFPISLFAQGILWIILQGVSLAGVQVLPSSMVAEITDHDQVIMGHRREGSFYSVWGLFNQVSAGLAHAIIPLFLLLGHARTDPDGPLGVRLLGLMGGILLITSFWVFRGYHPKAARGHVLNRLHSNEKVEF